MKIEKLADRYRIDNPDKFRLKDVNPGDTFGLQVDKAEAKEMLAESVKRMSKLQEKLYAQNRWAVLLIFQAMDAAGKDGAIAHVMSGINPQGCQVFSFKAPSTQELDHDYMWRSTIALPERGRIGVFNRSYYEEVLVVRVHPEILAKQRLPQGLAGKDVWKERFEDIRAFERYIARNGTLILKFMLHVSREEQAKRFLDRLDDPGKNWKFEMGDIEERRFWDDYMKYYEDAVRETSRPHAPWFVVPADNKWFTRLVISSAIVEAMDALDLHYPKVPDNALRQMQEVRAGLAAELPKAKNAKPVKG